MAGRIVLLGASGYTGSLTALALVRARARPLLVARSAQDLAALAVQLGHGLDTAAVDLAEPDQLAQLLQPGDIVLNAAGPFERHGIAVIEAAIQSEATYIDCAAEPAFLSEVFGSLSSEAAEAGVALIPGFGHMYVAGSLAAGLALGGLGERATRVDVGYFLTGSRRGAFSRGTRASRARAAMAPHYAWRAAPRSRPVRGQDGTVPVDGEDLIGLAMGGLEHLAIPRRHPSVAEVGVYVGNSNSARSARRVRRRVRQARRVPGAAGLVRRWGERRTEFEGPDPGGRDRTGSAVVAQASTPTAPCWGG